MSKHVSVSLLAALDRNYAIGKDNDMPWHLPDDLKRFKKLTVGKTVLMGRRTAEAIGRALPGRCNLVLTRRNVAPFADQQVVTSLDAAQAATAGSELLVIGGGEVYAMALPIATCMHLTWVDTAVDGADTYFPRYDPNNWNEVAREHHASDDRHAFAFDFADYVRAV